MQGDLRKVHGCGLTPLLKVLKAHEWESGT